MLSQAQVVMARTAIESQYTDRCNIIEKVKSLKPNKTTGFADSIVLQNQPCKLSFEKVSPTVQRESSALIVQSIKLFISPDVRVKPGSKISVTHNGITTDFQNSGEPALYATHQEIMLELFKGWS
ncbi:MAG: hypothetical protein RR012_01195 [Oscillospiraceae bacterium]